MASRPASSSSSRRRPTPAPSRRASSSRRRGVLALGVAAALAAPAALSQPLPFERGDSLPLRPIHELPERRLVPVAPAPSIRPAAPPAEILVQVDVNRQNLKETVIVLRREGELYIAEEDLRRWRLRVPAGGALEHHGARYHPVSALPGAAWELDEARQTLAVTTSSDAFDETTAALRTGASTQAVLPGLGGFLNYAVSASQTGSMSTSNGFFEGAVFGRHGVLTSTLVAPDLEERATWTRLDTTFTADFPDTLTSLRLGDSVTRAGAWGLPVRFGGVQYGTKFGVQPGFIPFPLATASGRAALPSTVDVFINNALVSRRDVPPGPFSLSNIPIVTGAGEVQVVVRDLLGREQVFSQSFYGSNSLLRSGVSDYSFELGRLRENFALVSNDYGEGLGVATYRRGLGDRLTGEVRTELAESAKSAGASVAFLAGGLGVANLAAAASDSASGSGRLFGAGFERSTQAISFGLQAEARSRGFRQAGMLPGELPPRRRSIANLGIPFGAAGTVSLTHAEQRFYDRGSLNVTTLSYSVPLGKLGQINFGAIRTGGASDSTSVFALLAVPLGDATSASAGMERVRNGGRTDSVSTFAVQKSLPLGEGFGYRLQARDENLYGSVAAQGPVGTYELEAARSESGRTATRLSARGGLATAGGHVFASREISDSFGVVRVADYPGVRVLQDNQVAGRTDENGYVVLPRLRAYDRNPISVEQNDLPMDARLDSLKLEATPYYRTGVFLDFPVRRVRAATLRVVLDDGSELPSGALGRVQGRAEEYPVALQGQAYLENLEPQSRVSFTWKGQRCEIELSLPNTPDPLPDLGTHVCKGVRP